MASEEAERDLLVTVLTDHGTEVVHNWLEIGRELTAGGAPPNQREERNEALTLVAALRDGLRTGLPTGDVVTRHEPLRDAVTRLLSRRARSGVPPTATALSMLSLKEALLGVAETRTDDHRLLYRTAVLVSRLLDAAGPQLVMNGVLEAIQSNEALVAIIDITGVPTVDAAVAHHLLQTVSAVRLMGAECLISGTWPTIAQTITQLGIDLSTITTRGTLAAALEEAIRLTGADVPIPDLVRGGGSE